MEFPIAIGVVGAGFGQQVHVPAFRAVPGCEVRAICASRIEKAQQAAKALDISKAVDDWRILVADPEISALSIAVPPALQVEIALAAAKAGKHLFCEKPLALNAGQARDIFMAAGRSGIVHAMDFIFPELAGWQSARKLLESGRLGHLRQVVLTWRVETYTYRTQARNWKTSAAAGGGTLNNFVSHSLYYLEWLFGPITRLMAHLGPKDFEVEARTDAWLSFAGGFSGTLAVSADSFLGPGHRLEVYGDAGTMVLENSTLDYARGFRLWLGTREAPRLESIELEDSGGHPDGRVQPVSRIAARFVQAIPSGARVVPGFEEGLRVQILSDTVRLAHELGSWQDVRS
jgi:predicted dehydrogenase